MTTTRSFAVGLLLVLLLLPMQDRQLAAQTPAATAANLPSFEAATVKLSKSGAPEAVRLGCHGTDGMSDAGIPGLPQEGIALGRCVVRNMPLKLILGFSYSMPGMEFTYRISGGTALDHDRYDIDAEAEQPTTEAQLKLMLRSLLIERFKLALHQETKERDVLNLVVADKGSKLKPSNEAPCVGGLDSGPCGSLVGQPLRGLRGRSVSIAALVSALALYTSATNVEDATGLHGLYDISTTGWNDHQNDPAEPSSVSDLPTLPTMLEESLGLKLKPAKKPVDVLVIDHAERPPQN